jgi:hypothetical protein
MSDINNYFEQNPNAPAPTGPDFTKEPHSWFAYVIDGEVAWIHVIPQSIEHFHAVLMSNPIIVEATPEVQLGWTYDGVTFSNPAI